MHSNTSEKTPDLIIPSKEAISFSEDAFYVEYSHAGTANAYCLHFTFRTITKAEDFLIMTSRCGFPVERVGNQVIILTDHLSPGILNYNRNTIAFKCDGSYSLEWTKFINENHANGCLAKYNQDKENDTKIVQFDTYDGYYFNMNLFQSKFSLVERINKTEKFIGYSVFILFALNHLFESSFLPKELIQLIMMDLVTDKIDDHMFIPNIAFQLPHQIIEKYKQTNCLLECNSNEKIFHLICSNNKEANLLFNQLNKNIPNLAIKIQGNEILMKSDTSMTINPDAGFNNKSKSYAGFYATRHQSLFFQNSINLYVKTKDTPKFAIECIQKHHDNYIYIPTENLRIRSDAEIVIFNEVIYPILQFIDEEMIARLKEGAKTMFISTWNNVCSWFGDNQNTINMDETIKNQKIACLINLKSKISEGLRIRTPLEDIINTWYQSILLETGGKTVYEIIHLDRENKACESTGSSVCIDLLLNMFSEKSRIALEETGCPDGVMNEYYNFPRGC